LRLAMVTPGSSAAVYWLIAGLSSKAPGVDRATILRL
jgi:hypothetical protein